MTTYELIPAKSLGPVRLGMTKAEAVDALGEEKRTVRSPKEHIVQWGDVQAYVSPDEPHEVRGVAAASRGDVQVTLEGVELLGADAEQVAAALRERGVEFRIDPLDSESLLGTGWACETIDGRIDNVVVEAP